MLLAELREAAATADAPPPPPPDKAAGVEAKRRGNEACKRREWAAALVHYDVALQALRTLVAAALEATPLPPRGEEDALGVVEMVAAVHGNCALAHLKMGQVVDSIESSDRAIACRPTWGKAHARRAAALEAAGDVVEAHRSLYDALRCEATSATYRRGLARLAPRARRLAALAAAAAAPSARTLLDAGDDPAALSERDTACVALLRAGRSLPAAQRVAHRFAPRETRLLELLEIDAALAALVEEAPDEAGPCRCAGVRLWVLRMATAIGLDVRSALLRCDEDDVGSGDVRATTTASASTAVGGTLTIVVHAADAAPTLHLAAVDAAGGVVARLRFACGLASWLLLESETATLPFETHFNFALAASLCAGGGRAVLKLERAEGSDGGAAGVTGRMVSELFAGVAAEDGGSAPLAAELAPAARPKLALFEADVA